MLGRSGRDSKARRGEGPFPSSAPGTWKSGRRVFDWWPCQGPICLQGPKGGAGGKKAPRTVAWRAGPGSPCRHWLWHLPARTPVPGSAHQHIHFCLITGCRGGQGAKGGSVTRDEMKNVSGMSSQHWCENRCWVLFFFFPFPSDTVQEDRAGTKCLKPSCSRV